MNTESFHQSQRGYFAGALLEQMKLDESIWVVTGDLGYGQFDLLQRTFPERFINVGAAEQTMLGVAVGLALEGKKPFVYTITSFFLRAAETISLYLRGEGLPVRLVGGGRDDDYKHDGASHDATEAQKFLNQNLAQCFYPDTKEEVPDVIARMVKSDKPAFISLKR